MGLFFHPPAKDVPFGMPPVVRTLVKSRLPELLPPPENIDPKHPFQDPGPVRGRGWVRLVQQVGWAKAVGTSLALTPTGKTVMQDPDPKHLREAVGRLRAADSFDELHRVNGLRGLNGKGRRYLIRASERRGIVLDGLGKLTAGRWVTRQAFQHFLVASGNPLRIGNVVYDLYFGSPHYGHLGGDEDLARWFLASFLFESLALLGVVDVGYTAPHGLDPAFRSLWGVDDIEFFTPSDGVLFLRLTNLGAFCLDLRPSYVPPAQTVHRVLHVLPNLDIALTGTETLLPADRMILERFARPNGKGVWQLTPGSLRGYVEQGGDLDEIIAFLRPRSQSDLPATVLALVDDARKARQAVGTPEPMLLFPIDDPVTAALIAADARARSVCRLVGDRDLLVAGKNRRAFESALRRLGFVPPTSAA